MGWLCARENHFRTFREQEERAREYLNRVDRPRVYCHMTPDLGNVSSAASEHTSSRCIRFPA